MSRKKPAARLYTLEQPLAEGEAFPEGPFAARLVAIGGDGVLLVEDSRGRQHLCDYLAGAAQVGGWLAIEDLLLVHPVAGAPRPVVMGRIGPYPPTLEHVVLESTSSMTLRCGASSIDLRADGKVMIRGEDVLVRAKGTQRIRAGTVSIN
jgi:hypothetical protein